MAYLIQACLEQGAPALALIDARTGQVRLNWRAGSEELGERALRDLFRRLILLSCSDGLNLPQRAMQGGFGEECLVCQGCVEPAPLAVARYALVTPPARTGSYAPRHPIPPNQRYSQAG